MRDDIVAQNNGAWNKMIGPNHYPIVAGNKLLDELHGTTIILTFYLNSGYYQIWIKEKDISKNGIQDLWRPLWVCSSAIG